MFSYRPAKYIVLLITLCTIINNIQAQDDDIDSKDRTSYFKAGLSYITNNVYNGRTDSLAVPYLTPSLGYYHKSGLFVKADVALLVSSYATRADMFTVEGGYRFAAGDNFTAEVTASKYFFSQYSTSVKSSIKEYANFSLSYDAGKFITLEASGSYLFTDGPGDFVLTPGISHEFTWGADEDWSFEPDISADFGTRHYHDLFKQGRRVKTGKKIKLSDSTITSNGNDRIVTQTAVDMVNPGQVMLLDVSLTAPLYYDVNRWSFFISPGYAIPFNAAEYNNTVTRTVRRAGGGIIDKTMYAYNTTETLKQAFYVELGCKVKL